MESAHITVCICTYRRPEMLKRLLTDLSRQETGGFFTYSVVVADNDAAQSGKTVVEKVAVSSPIEIIFSVEPQKNIALVRNRALENARGNYVAFIDDDEFPVQDWLLQLFRTCIQEDADGVLGPVRPHFDEEPPLWVRRCGLYERPEHPTDFKLGWRECRTGNVLLRRDILPKNSPPFDPRFHNGGEDQDFFRRLIQAGRRFVWCNEAVAYETVPPIRWSRKVLIQRALLRGKNTLKHADITAFDFLKSVAAIVVYGLALPFLAIVGMHLFTKYLIKLCDHLGKLLAIFGINPVAERLG